MKVDWKNISITKHDFKSEDYNFIIDSNLIELVKIKEFKKKNPNSLSFLCAVKIFYLHSLTYMYTHDIFTVLLCAPFQLRSHI